MKKFLEWLKSAGIRSIGYLGIAVLIWIFLGWKFASGIFVGVFLADNWVTIRKLIESVVPDKNKE